MGSTPAQRTKTDILILTDANTEYSYALMPYTKQFAVKARTLDMFKFSWQNGESGTKYKTIPAGAEFYARDLLLTDQRTFYVQSPIAGLVLEIEIYY